MKNRSESTDTIRDHKILVNPDITHIREMLQVPVPGYSPYPGLPSVAISRIFPGLR